MIPWTNTPKLFLTQFYHDPAMKIIYQNSGHETQAWIKFSVVKCPSFKKYFKAKCILLSYDIVYEGNHDSVISIIMNI